MSDWRAAARAAMLALEEVPPVRRLRRWDYDRRRFPTWPNACLGVFDTFDAARRAAPGRTGYDHPEMACLYDELIGHLQPADYPAMFWLQRVLRSGSSVFDFGGHVGITYYTYAPHLELPPDLRWTVCDVPAVVGRGLALAQERGATAQLGFTSRIEDAAGCDVLLAFGSLQYVETDLATVLSHLDDRPRHLLVNKTPMLPGREFVTLQNTQFSFNPYRLFDVVSFVDRLARAGYELVDSWENPDISCVMPYHDERSEVLYRGMYLRAR